MGCIISYIFYNYTYPPINYTTQQIFNKDLNITLNHVIVSTHTWLDSNGGIGLLYPREFYIYLKDIGMCEYIYTHTHIIRMEFINHFKNKFINDNNIHMPLNMT